MADAPFARALAALRAGGLVAIPTETVYGLAADAENELAVRRIFGAKGRPADHPLIVHHADAERAFAWAREVPAAARTLADAFWPGPLTLVLRRGPRALDVVTGGQDTVGLRVPSHPLTHRLLEAFGGGLAAPSANRHGRLSPTTAQHVAEELAGLVEVILDGGACSVGVESTIVDLSGDAPALLRPGGVPLEALERALGRQVAAPQASAVRAPGMLASHYAPRAGVVPVAPGELAARVAELIRDGRRVAVLAPSLPVALSGATHLPTPADAEGLARVLYAELRRVDALGLDVAVVSLPSGDGLGLAVIDRLARAAAPRP